MPETRSPGHRFATLYDTAKRCLIILDALYLELERHLQAIADPNGIADKSAVAVGIYTCVFSIIDFGNRFVQIVDAMPLISKKQPELKQLHKATESLTQSRNYVQHMRNHLSKTATIDFPILGSIAWIQDDRNFVILPTQSTEGYAVPSIPYDRETMRYSCKYQFCFALNHTELRWIPYMRK